MVSLRLVLDIYLRHSRARVNYYLLSSSFFFFFLSRLKIRPTNSRIRTRKSAREIYHLTDRPSDPARFRVDNRQRRLRGPRERVFFSFSCAPISGGYARCARFINVDPTDCRRSRNSEIAFAPISERPRRWAAIDRPASTPLTEKRARVSRGRYYVDTVRRRRGGIGNYCRSAVSLIRRAIVRRRRSVSPGTAELCGLPSADELSIGSRLPFWTRKLRRQSTQHAASLFYRLRTQIAINFRDRSNEYARSSIVMRASFTIAKRTSTLQVKFGVPVCFLLVLNV